MNKILCALCIISGVIIGSFINQLILMIKFSPENELVWLRILGGSCFIFMWIYPVAMIVIINTKNKVKR